MRVAEAVPAGAAGAEGGGGGGRAAERARGAARGQDPGVAVRDGEDGGRVGQRLPGVQAGAVDRGGRRQGAVRAVVQVHVLQLGAPDLPRQGHGVRAAQGGGGRRAQQLRRGGGAGARRGAQAVHHTSHEEWLHGNGQEKAPGACLASE